VTDKTRQSHGRMEPRFVGYFVRLALLSVAAVALVFAVATAVIVLVKPSPGWGLAIVAAAVVLAVAALSVLSRRLTARFLGHRAPDRAGGPPTG